MIRFCSHVESHESCNINLHTTIADHLRVADCSTVWVGKCLQLIYRGALHLTLFEIYRRNCSSSQSNKLVSSNPGHAWPCLCLCPYVARNRGRHRHKSVRVIRTLHESARIIANPHLSGKEQCWNGDRVWAPSWSVRTAPAKADDFACEHNSWRDMGCLKGKPVVHFQSTKAKYKDHSQGDVLETSSCARTRQETCMFCSQETRCLMWWQPSECPQDLARANWTAAFISLMDLHILWLGWSQNCWINWHLTVAKCTVPSGLSHRLCCNTRAVRIIESVLLAVSVAPKGILLMLQSVTPHSHITVSPATCHPVQCSPNMRVAGCATVWVCKCLQLIYLHALPLTLFDIYSTIYIIKCLRQRSLCATTMYPWLKFLWTLRLER